MSKRKTPKTKSAVEIAQSVSSPVALGMIQRGSAGAGRHGGSVRTRNRRDRQGTRQALRRGDW